MVDLEIHMQPAAHRLSRTETGPLGQRAHRQSQTEYQRHVHKATRLPHASKNHHKGIPTFTSHQEVLKSVKPEQHFSMSWSFCGTPSFHTTGYCRSSLDSSLATHDEPVSCSEEWIVSSETKLSSTAPTPRTASIRKGPALLVARSWKQCCILSL